MLHGSEILKVTAVRKLCICLYEIGSCSNTTLGLKYWTLRRIFSMYYLELVSKTLQHIIWYLLAVILFVTLEEFCRTFIIFCNILVNFKILVHFDFISKTAFAKIDDKNKV